jgi:hypothetical protein
MSDKLTEILQGLVGLFHGSADTDCRLEKVHQAILSLLMTEEEIEGLIKDLDWGIKESKFGDGFDWVAIQGKLVDKLPKAVAQAIHNQMMKKMGGKK